MTDQNLGLRTGAAANQAAEVLSGSWRAIADGKITAEQLVALHFQLAEGFFQNANTIQNAATVGQAFPGTTQASPQETQQFQQAAPAPAPAPSGFGNVVAPQGGFGQQAPQQPQGQNFQPAPGVQAGVLKADQEWMQLFNNPSGFYDNRGNKRSPSSPDFKAKQGDLALWLNGKYGPAPQWVFDRLQGGAGPVQ